MEKIIFKKEALLASFWDVSEIKWVNRPVASSELPITWFLPYIVEIEEGLTIREILGLISPYIEQIDFIFINYLKGLSYQKLVDALFSSPITEEVHKSDATCLLWVAEVKTVNGENHTDVCANLTSIEFGPDEDEDDSVLYPLTDMTISQLLDKELVLDDWLELANVMSPDEILYEGVNQWTLFDFIGGILSELAIYAYSTGLVSFEEGSGLVPINSIDLFDHIDSLDNFYKIV